ncbi:phenylacetate--CoA ligase family protein [Candidatus Jordarchaeum sp.]|uniref:phenylacetate--CoA ligase family protein n=1 Tax=Candidatus Jordarchaeum sp. TaxID=2823881 RepID=UPI00404A13E4
MFMEPDMSREELLSLQEKKFKRTMELAFKTPLYSRKFKEAGLSSADITSINDLEKLPFSSKQDIVKDYRAAIADYKDLSVFHTTSGTSGTPTVVGYTNNDVEVQTSNEARNLLTAGFKKGDTIIQTSSYGLFFAGLCFHEALRGIGAVVVPAGKQATSRQQADMIHFYRPTGIIGIPQFILKWATLYEEMFGEDPRESSLSRGYALGEPVPEGKRKRIEDIWDIDLRIGYGLTEVGSGGECEEKYGVHWPEDLSLMEVIDPETDERVAAGERGEMVYTTISRTGTLAIRFCSRDSSYIVGGNCSCGRITRRVMPPEFRLDGLVKIKGTLTSPFAIDSAIFSYEGVRDYLVVVTEDSSGLDRIDVFIDSDLLTSSQVESLSDRFGGKVWFKPSSVKVVEKDSIPVIGRKGKKIIDLRVEADYGDELKSFLEKYGESAD